MMDFDQLVTLKIGDTFTYRGRTYTMFDGSGWTWGSDAKGEYAQVKVFGNNGGSRFITIREDEA